MKKMYLLLICLSYFTSNGQNLTLNQLLEIRSKDLGYAEEFLMKNNWDLLDASEADENGIALVSFVYKKNYYPIKQNAILGYIYNTDTAENIVSLQIIDKTKYIEYINTIKKFGCVLVSTEVEDSDIIKVYKGATTTFEIRSSRSSDSISTNWIIAIFTNERYHQIFQNKIMQKAEDLDKN